MEICKKIGRALLLPHMAVMILLVPIATVFLVYSMAVLGTETVPAYVSYVLAAYTLTVWCVRIPSIVRFCKGFKKRNKYAKMWFDDVRLRTTLILYGSLLWNTAYALLQLWLGVYHQSLWFYAMAGYYMFLALMRIFLASHTRRYTAGEKMLEELKKYRFCGWIFLGVNMALTVMIIFMIYRNRSFVYDQITTIALAAYTFTAFTVAIVNIIRYRRYHSPVYSASKAISLAAACVSMITLTSTMLTTFGGEGDMMFRRLMLSLIGGAASVFIIGMAAYMIKQSSAKIKVLQTEETHGS